MGKEDLEDDGEHWMLREKRATRGKRMASLVGEAAEEDEAFWGHDVWQSDAESYSSEEERPDHFDSDFNETEDEEEGSNDEREGPSKKSNRYKDPTAPKKTAAAAPAAPREAAPAPAPRAAKRPREEKDAPVSQEETGPRALRHSTKEKSSEADLARERREAEGRQRARPYTPRVKALFNQEEMLREALQTEEENIKWLEARKHLQAEKDLAEKALKKEATVHGEFIRYHSSRECAKTITFSSSELMPAIFTASAPPRPKKTCAITGLPAMYRDPVTRLPYANLAAFKEIRKRYAI